MVVDCTLVNCMPVELFLGFIAMAIAMAIFGFMRQPQIPAMVSFAGIFILFISIMISGLIMGKIPTESIEVSASTTQYEFTDNVFDFTGFPQVIFGFVGSIMALTGGLMVNRT